MQAVLDVQHLEVTYHTRDGNLKALHDIQFSIQPGEIVGIVGESGCGKSTISSALLGLLPPNGEISAGMITLNGRSLRNLNSEELRSIRGREISMVFQDPMTSLNPAFTVGEQMIDAQQAHDEDHLSRRELRHRAIEILRRAGVPDPEVRIDYFPHQFSGGLRQRILIAMALLTKPAVLIADEPTSALDVTMEAQILEMIKELRATTNTSVIFISHDLGVIAQLCDRIVVMYAGRVVEQGDIYAVFEKPQHPYTRALLASVPSRLKQGQRLMTIPGRVPGLSSLPAGCKFADRCALAQKICHLKEPGITQSADVQVRCFACQPAHAGEFEEVSQETAVPPAPAESAVLLADAAETPTPLIQTIDLCTCFKENRKLVDILTRRPPVQIRAVDGINLTIRAGEVIGLVGESGCGKTTLGKTILGLLPASEGEIEYRGRSLHSLRHEERRSLRSKMQMIFQDPISSLSPRLKLSYLLTEPYAIHKVPAEQRYSVSALLEMVGLSDEQRDKFPHQVSGGQARRIGIARALAMRPEFIVADEPTSGLDVSVAASIINLMKDLAERFHLTYLIISHNLNVVSYISNRIAVMYLGNLVEVGPTKELFEHPAHPYTMALLSSISEPDPQLRHQSRRLIISGEIPSPRNPPSGCRFHSRCPFCID
ncbi:MAG TPA: ABC transporter ATP-binding protein, partial [Anaerolineaceae bacterium]|nr:ABC transporter ATP-binding protein [Anaerolineaceae bacterium]